MKVNKKRPGLATDRDVKTRLGKFYPPPLPVVPLPPLVSVSLIDFINVLIWSHFLRRNIQLAQTWIKCRDIKLKRSR